MSQKTKQPKRRPPTTIPTQRAAHEAELVDDMAEFLDEVDAILEENELEVVRTFRQKPGE